MVARSEDALLGGGCSLDDDDRYKLCDPLTLQCPQCAHKFAFRGVASLCSASASASRSPLECPQCPRENEQGTDAMVTPVKSAPVLQAAGGSPGVLTGAMLSNQVGGRRGKGQPTCER